MPEHPRALYAQIALPTLRRTDLPGLQAQVDRFAAHHAVWARHWAQLCQLALDRQKGRHA